jgi:hypothetical protein
MRLINSPLCRWCGEEEETSAHILCECDALASLRHTYLVSFFMDPEDVIRLCLSLRVIWNFCKGTVIPWPGHQIMGHKGPVKKAYVHWEWKALNSLIILFYSILLHIVYKLSGCVMWYGELQDDFHATNVCVVHEHNQYVLLSTGATGHLYKCKHF